MTRLWRSLSFRLALLYAAVLGVSLTALGAVYYLIAIVMPMNALRDGIANEAAQLVPLYEKLGAPGLAAALVKRSEEDEGLRAFHAFFGPDKTVITSNLPSVPSAPFDMWVSIEADVYYEGDELDFSALALDHHFPDGARLIVGRDAEDLEDLEEVFLATAPWVIALTLGLGVFGGLFMSRAIGRRIDRISQTALQVMHGDMGGRVPVRGSGDDFDRLGETLNLMLERNERLMESIRRVSDHVAHELRTPLARLMGQLEQMDSAGALEEAERLQRIFDALLRISRIEGGRHEAELREMDLGRIAADARDLHAPAAQARSITLRVETDGAVKAKVEPELIFQVFVNLLDNALKHVPDNGEIVLGVERREGRAVISVSDNGAGLQPGEIEHITERFFRGANAAGKPGDGLGLSIVAAIAMLHGGRLQFANNAPGLRAELVLPA